MAKKKLTNPAGNNWTDEIVGMGVHLTITDTRTGLTMVLNGSITAVGVGHPTAVITQSLFEIEDTLKHNYRLRADLSVGNCVED